MSYLRKEIHVFGLSSHIMSHKCLSHMQVCITPILPKLYSYLQNNFQLHLLPFHKNDHIVWSGVKSVFPTSYHTDKTM